METENNLPTKTLSELKVEIKFHLGQMAGHAVEIGNCLIQAKEQVQHGEWQNWLEDNFNLKKSSAANFINIAQRFGGNFQTFGNLGYSQMLNLLALPSGEEENFIAEKAAENNPVEDMTVKQLREEIKSYKARLETAEQERDGYKTSAEIVESRLETLDAGIKKFSREFELDSKQVDEVISELSQDNTSAALKEKISELKKQLQTVTTFADPSLNAEELREAKTEIAKLQAELEEKQEELKNLQDSPVEVAVEYPADYDSIKSELAELKNQQKNLQEEYAVTKKITEMFSAIPVLQNFLRLNDVVSKMADKDTKFGEKIINLGLIHRELENCFNIWRDKREELENA